MAANQYKGKKKIKKNYKKFKLAIALKEKHQVRLPP
jgi:hypothetical protein